MKLDPWDGQVRLELRHPWRDGTTGLVFDPVEFLGRLAVLVPRPRSNLLLYHGVLGARSSWRPEVVPHRPPGEVAATSVGEPEAIPAREADEVRPHRAGPLERHGRR